MNSFSKRVFTLALTLTHVVCPIHEINTVISSGCYGFVSFHSAELLPKVVDSLVRHTLAASILLHLYLQLLNLYKLFSLQSKVHLLRMILTIFVNCGWTGLFEGSLDDFLPEEPVANKNNHTYTHFWLEFHLYIGSFEQYCNSSFNF